MLVGRTPSIRPGRLGYALACLLILALNAAAPLRSQAADTVLHTFNSYGDGANPESALIQGQDGAYYGTTYAAGTNRYGTVFKIDSTGALTTLHSFTGSDGEDPYAGLVQGSDGTLYGVTVYGGSHSNGVVFKLKPDGSGFSVLHSFAYAEGANPYGTLILASDGNLYGTAYAGGSNGYGAVFKMSTDGAVFNTIHSFAYSEGVEPYDGLVQGTDGNLYGTTSTGGANGYGAVFKCSTGGTLSTLHAFASTDGAVPYASLIQASDGNLYGTTEEGGANGYGTVFQISTDGTVFNTVHTFASTDGSYLYSGVIQGSDGNLYGTTSEGGTNGDGTVFQVSTNGSVFNTLHSFNPSTDGRTPDAGVVEGADGLLHGTTVYSPSAQPISNGTIYSIGLTGTGFTLFHDFSNGFFDGQAPAYGDLVIGSDGNFYGVTQHGGALGYGALYRMTGAGVVTILHSFISTDGSGPMGSVVFDSGGNIYGTTYFGGSHSRGVVYEFTPSTGVLTVLHNFSGSEGYHPASGLILVSGSLYGTTISGGASNYGVVYTFNLSTSTFQTLHSFASSDGAAPYAPLLLAADGNLYGATQGGGSNSYGTVFKINTAGSVFSTLHAFNNSDGAYPYGGLIQGSDGNLYGTTTVGGANTYGTVFQISTDGTVFNTLHAFANSDGGYLYAGVIQGSDGNLYGTAYQGGANSGGLAYQLSTNGSVYNILYSFGPAGSDGIKPYGGLVQASNGLLYGTASASGVWPDDGFSSPDSSVNIQGAVYSLSTQLSSGPIITSLSPNAATAGGSSFTLTVNGSNFISGAVVQWTAGGTTTNLTTTFVSTGQLTATVPASLIANAGTASITVTQSGLTSNAATFTINNLVPVLNSISPNSANAGGPTFTLTANGNSFVSTSTINWNGTALATTFVSSTQLQATVPAADIASPGTASVTVFSPAPGGGTSAAQTFTITNPAPVLSSISPNSTLVGGPAFTLTANGSSFMSTSTINWNGTALTTTYVSASQLTATVPAADIASPGTASVTVTTPAPGGGTSAAQIFTIDNPAPVLSSISPTSATAGGPAFTLTANGSSFMSTSTINWNGTALTTTYVSATQLTATVPAADIASPSTASVTVFSPAPGGGTSGAQTFTINYALTITSISPSSAAAGGATFKMTVNGAGYATGAIVEWTANGTTTNLATAFNSATKLTATVPASLIANVGTASVTVLLGGQSSNPATFTIINPAPSLTSLTPSSADAGGPAFAMTVRGKGFDSNSVIYWNGSPLTTNYVSGTQLTTTVPAADITSAGTASVTVVNPAPGGGTSNALTFTILVTTVKATGAKMSVVGGGYQAVITLKNSGFATAPSVTVTSSTLGGAATTTTLPVVVGDITAGATKQVTLIYPSSAGTTGQKVSLTIAGTFTGGTFSSTLTITLP